MDKVIVINRSNNIGDLLCHLRGLREWKDQHPNTLIDFASCFSLYSEVACHTDIFNEVMCVPVKIDDLALNYKQKGYLDKIEFKNDWKRSLRDGLLSGWVYPTLGFIPKNQKPYFNIDEEEEYQAKGQHTLIMSKFQFRKSVLIQPEAPSNRSRGFLPCDYDKLADLIPNDCAIFYPASITRAIENSFTSRKNLLTLPAYPIGLTAALMKIVDLNLVVHGGFAFLAYAVNAPHIIQMHFLKEGGLKLLTIPRATDVVFGDNESVDWDKLKKAIDKYL
jgi:hypothetical protein